jgi:S-adenosylmethionine:tRNA ribosyltransferase-isomerase
MLSLSDYDYHLDPSLIAQSPATPPGTAKCLYRDGQHYKNQIVRDIPKLLDPHTLIMFNDTKVVKARIPLTQATRTTPKGKTETLEKGEIFFLEHTGKLQFEVLINPGRKFQIGDNISQNNRSCTVIAITEYGRILESNKPINEILEQYGQTPLPPYIEYDETVVNRYQSVMAKKNGSVAAPTASLHFTSAMIEQLKQQGHSIETLTLHVWLGTFKTVQSEDITQHDIHNEKISIPHYLWDTIASAKQNWNPILAIGTTVTRSLESLPYIWKLLSAKNQQLVANSNYRDTLTQSINIEQAHLYISSLETQEPSISCSTRIFLYPGKSFLIVDQLLTNFHLPKSSLLMLVAAFMGYENMMACYHHALQEKYRFFSFWDCMLLKSSAQNHT